MPEQEFAVSSLMDITERPEIVFVKGQGSWLTDHRGKRYLDFVQGWAVTCLGHCPRVVTEALAAQAAELITPSPAFYNEPSLRLAGLIAKHSSFQRVFFTNSGAEANEGAIKLARKWGRRFKGGAFEIITFDHGFHGRTLATMSASGKPGWDTMFAPQVEGFPKATLNDIASVEERITDRTAAVMLEPVQGEAGVFRATVPFLRELRALTKRHNCLLIADEIQTGMGRTGKLWGVDHTATVPDIMCLGKAIGGGVMPLSAFIAPARIWEVMIPNPIIHSTTFGGNPIACAAGLAAIAVTLEEDLPGQAAAKGAFLLKELATLQARYPQVLTDAHGLGLLIGMEFPTDEIGYACAAGLFKRGVLVAGTYSKARTIRIEPPLGIPMELLKEMLNRLEDTFKEIAGAQRST